MKRATLSLARARALSLSLTQTHTHTHTQGEFAFVYWEAKGRRLWLGRDRLGRRSLLIKRGGITCEGGGVSRSEAGGGVQVGAGRETEYNSDGVEAGGQDAAGVLGGWGQWIAI